MSAELFLPSFRPDPVQPRLFDATVDAFEHAQRAVRAEGAGLVPSKTTGPDFLEVSFQHEIVQERGVGRLRRIVWACGHLHRFASPKGFRENVWFCTLTYKGVDDWQVLWPSTFYPTPEKDSAVLGSGGV